MAAPKFTPSHAIGDVKSYRSPDIRPRPVDAGPAPAISFGRQPKGPRLGFQGPDQGYGLSLANRLKPQLVLSDNERGDDAVAGASAVALRRASLFGRAPVVHDLRIAFTIWGFLDPAPPAELVALRLTAVRSARRSAPLRRRAGHRRWRARVHAEHVAGRGRPWPIRAAGSRSSPIATDGDRSSAPVRREPGGRRGPRTRAPRRGLPRAPPGTPMPASRAPRPSATRTRTTGRRAAGRETRTAASASTGRCPLRRRTRETAPHMAAHEVHARIVASVLAAAGPVVPGDRVHRTRHQLATEHVALHAASSDGIGNRWVFTGRTSER